MEVVLLGTGTLTPQAETASAGVAVVEGDHVLPIDLGRNVLSRMVECGLDPLRLSEFFVTHLHPDHTCELVSLLFAARHARSAPGPLRLVGPAGLDALVAALYGAWEWLRADYPLRIDEIGPGPVEASGFEVEAVRLEHGTTEDLGYRVRSPRSGRTVAFTGDTGPCEALVELARGVDVLVSECASTDSDASAVHLSPTPLGEAAERAGVRHLVITHLYPQTPAEAVVDGVRARFKGEVTIGTDRMRIRAA